MRLFMGFSVCQSQSCVRCVLACTSPVAVHPFEHAPIADLFSLRVRGQWLLDVMQACEACIEEGFVFPSTCEYLGTTVVLLKTSPGYLQRISGQQASWSRLRLNQRNIVAPFVVVPPGSGPRARNRPD